MKAVPPSIEEVAREFHRIRSQKQGRPRFPSDDTSNEESSDED